MQRQHSPPLQCALSFILAPDPRITVLTGQPGVGKSALLLAIARLVIGSEKINLCAELPPFPIKPIIHLPIRSNIGKAEMYTLAAREIGLDHEYEARSDANLRHLQLRLIQHGSCGILTDELQFVTRSSNANSQVSVLITRLADLGLPLTLTMNYSLVHKLKKRPPEERARVPVRAASSASPSDERASRKVAPTASCQK